MSVITLLSAVSATGAGNSFGVFETDKFTVSSNFTVAGGSITALTTDLEGSLDNSDWFTLGSYAFVAADLTNQEAMFHVINKFVNYIRCNIITLTKTGTPSINVYCNYIGNKNMFNYIDFS